MIFLKPDEKLLSQTVTRLSDNEILSDKTQRICQTLKEVSKLANGVGAAANQIGFDAAIFVINISKERAERENCDAFDTTIFINPSYEPLHHSKISYGSEACFSLPGLKGNSIPRYEDIIFSALNEDGKQITINASGFLARVLQHETDHLNGLRYIERIPNFDWQQFHKWAESPSTEALPKDLELINLLECPHREIKTWLIIRQTR